MWRGHALPNTVAPTFETCNISREYKVDVRVGLSYSGASGGKARKAEIPQSIVLPLRLDAEVLSGIRPPAALLEAMARSKADVKVPPTLNEKAAGPSGMPGLSGKQAAGDAYHQDFGAGQVPPTPVEEFAGPSVRLGEVGNSSAGDALPPAYSEAPPSYEDAIATGLPPVDAPRPDYAPPPAVEDDLLGRDEKRR